MLPAVRETFYGGPILEPMKLTSILPLVAALAPSLAPAATITFGFEGLNHTPSSAGSGFVSGNLSEVLNSGAAPIYGGFTGSTAPLATTTVRAFRPSDVVNRTTSTNTNTTFNSNATYVEFTITPDAGQRLDFSSAQFSFNLGSFVGVGSTAGITNRAAMGYRVNGTGSFTLLGSTIEAVVPAFASSANKWTGTSSFDTTPNGFAVAETTSLESLSTIPALGSNDSITFRVILGDTGSTSVALTASNDVRGGYIDAISVSGFNVIPEPTVILFALFSPVVLMRRRRIN